jgi:hypothetical protein
VEKCGILRSDALKYEANLIENRMSPDDTFMEAACLIVKVGKIPVGDKIQISKTIDRQQDAMEKARMEGEKAREKLGLGAFSEMHAQTILFLAGGSH